MGVICTIILAYIIGSFPFIWWWKRRRFYHSPSFVLLLFLDVLKGLLAVVLGLLISGWLGACIAAVVVVIGCMYPWISVYPPSRGLAVAAGALLIISPWLLIIGGIVFVLSLLLTRFVFLSNCLTILSVCILGVFFVQLTVWVVLLVIGALLIYKQKDHWNRYKRGVEPWFRLSNKLIR